MSAIPMFFRPGDTLVIRDDGGFAHLWGVVERKRGGYLLKPHDGADARTWSDDELDEAHSSRRLVHHACNVANIPKNFYDVLQKTWEYWPEDLRLEAERRAEYVQMVESIRDSHATLMDAYSAAIDIVYNANRDRWHEENKALAQKRVADENKKKKRAARAADEPEVVVPEPKKPGCYTLRGWYKNWSTNGRDIRLLIPQYHLRGRHGPRKKTEPGDTPDTYKLMKEAADLYYFAMPRKRKKFAHKKFEDLCKEKGVESMSERTFRVYLNDNYDDKYECAKRYGRRAAYLKFGVFERTKPPERPLEEVEVDHCLIDLIVVHPVTKRPLGRPWLTALIDRATRVILGAHLSFEVPSYASLQRAMAHAMWKKDLSGIEGLEHSWPCHGVWDWLICDNGKEFRSKSLRLSATMLDFVALNLPVKQPWLKGAVERLFGRMGVQVFSHLEGTTLSRTKDFYDPVGRAQYSLAEVNFKILKWIVDDYHETIHDTLKCRPIEKWRELTDRYPVNAVPDFDHIIRLTGEVIERKISNVGIPYEGLLYADKKKLERLLCRRGGRDKYWHIRFDPYDLGEVWILDDEVGEWLTIPCTDQQISRGISKYQHKVHKLIAQKNAPKGAEITTFDLANAKDFAEATVIELFSNGAKTSTATKAARYHTNGAYFTPLTSSGFSFTLASIAPSIPLIIDHGEESARSLEAGQPSKDLVVANAPVPAAPKLPILDLNAEIEAMVKEWTRISR